MGAGPGRTTSGGLQSTQKVTGGLVVLVTNGGLQSTQNVTGGLVVVVVLVVFVWALPAEMVTAIAPTTTASPARARARFMDFRLRRKRGR